MTATDTQPALADLLARIRRGTGGMATTWEIATALGIPETAVAPLTAQARRLGLIITERDPRTMSPMHRLTSAGRACAQSPALQSAADLDALPVGARVTDNEGDVWTRLHPGTWHYRCNGGLSRSGRPSVWLAGFAPLTVLPGGDDLPAAADPGDVPSATTLRYQAEGDDAVREALDANGPIEPVPDHADQPGSKPRRRARVPRSALDAALSDAYIRQVIDNAPAVRLGASVPTPRLFAQISAITSSANLAYVSDKSGRVPRPHIPA